MAFKDSGRSGRSDRRRSNPFVRDRWEEEEDYSVRTSRSAGGRESYGVRTSRSAEGRESYGVRTSRSAEGRGPGGPRALEKRGPGGPRAIDSRAKSNIDRFRKKPAGRLESGYNRERHSENTQKRGDGFIRLNRYIANAGICSRREADEMIANGVIKVNGEICTVLGTLVGPGDKVQFGDQTLKAEKKVYLVMNKPKGYITTVEDPEERRTVMDLIEGACKERVYPVGRLDRNTTGVLLFTNDGDMAKKLTHPSHGARKIYHVTLDKALEKSDLQTLVKGVHLEDGMIAVDEAEYVEGSSRKEVGVQIHSGRNRIVRRIFEYLGYEVVKLDRVLFAEITKKDMSRGQWRFLTEKEIGFLRMNTGEGVTAGKKAAKKTVSKFTDEQLEEAEAIALAEEGKPQKRTRTTRKKDAGEDACAPKATRTTRKKVAETEPEAKPKAKRTTRKKKED